MATPAGQWIAGTDGWGWEAEIRSPGAAGLRLHFSGVHLGSGTVEVSNSRRSVVFSGGGPLGDGEFWSDTLGGESLQVRYRPADGADREALPFAIDRVAHFENPATAGSKERAVAGCHADVTSYPNWATPSRSVAMLIFETKDDSGASRWIACSGVLLATKNNSRRPYLLTANHCIHSDQEARTLESYWLFQSPAANAWPAAFDDVSGFPRVLGARIVYALGGSEGDATLLELNGPAPAGVTFANWSGAEPALGSNMTIIHHPDGTFKRIAFGAYEDSPIGDRVANTVLGLPIFRPSDYYYEMSERIGFTQGGSSGSPVFNDAVQMVGTLSFGPAYPDQYVCFVPNRSGVYARFSVLYPRIQALLNEEPAGGCDATTSAVNQTAGTAALDGTFQVNAPANCSWTVAADNNWTHVLTPKTGRGNGSVSFRVSPNPSQNGRASYPRAGSISVVGEQRRVVHYLQRGTIGLRNYTDMQVTHPFADAINFLAEQGVTPGGCDRSGGFCPETVTNRGMMAEFIIRSIYPDGRFTVPPVPYFSDVPSSHPRYSYIQKLRDLRITDGCTETVFCADEPVTRGQMAVFVVRAWLVKNEKDSRGVFPSSTRPMFNDVPATHPWFPHIQKLGELGITSGCAAGRYCPDDANTRGQIAVFLTRSLFALWDGRTQ